VSVHTLAEFPRSTRAASAVRQCKVVEHQQLPGLQIDRDLDILNAEAVVREEGELGRHGVELQTAEKARVPLDAREQRRAPGRGALDQAGEASLDIAPLVVPRAVRATVGGQPLDQFSRWRPGALAKERDQWHQTGDGLDTRDVGRDVQGRIARNFLLNLRVKRQSEVEVQRLKVPRHPLVEGCDDKPSDDRQWRKTVALPARVDEGTCNLVRVVTRRERTCDVREPVRIQVSGKVAHPHISRPGVAARVTNGTRSAEVDEAVTDTVTLPRRRGRILTGELADGDHQRPCPWEPSPGPMLQNGFMSTDLEELHRLRRARDQMDREYAQPLDVAALARTALMSQAHFSRRFRETYAETPYSYLMTRRIERAMALLRRGDVSVTEACFAVGWTSLGSFSARFTEVVGVTPSVYRAGTHDEFRAMPSCLAMVLTRPRKSGPSGRAQQSSFEEARVAVLA
jgi:AraC-like DNA-binding protein